MKKDIHADNFRTVAFKDIASGEVFLVRSTVKTESVLDIADKEYPLFEVETSSASHPFYTGRETQLDAEGRAEKFRAKIARAGSDPSDKSSKKATKSSVKKDLHK